MTTVYFAICDPDDLDVVEIGNVEEGDYIFVQEKLIPYPINESEYGTYVAFDLFPFYSGSIVRGSLDDWDFGVKKEVTLDGVLRPWQMYPSHGLHHYDDGGQLQSFYAA